MFLLTPNAAKIIATPRIWSIGAVAGLAGGLVEITWISIYQNLSGGDAAQVARGIAATLVPNLSVPGAALPLGIAIHVGLAVMLGIAIAVFVRTVLPKNSPPMLEPLAVIALLIGIWAANFLLILPAINPAFVTLVPYAATLASKVLFGVAAALVLRRFDRPRLYGPGD